MIIKEDWEDAGILQSVWRSGFGRMLYGAKRFYDEIRSIQ